MLRRGIDAILSAKTLTGSTVNVVIGHATFCSLLARPSMTCFHSVYKYIRRLGPSRGILWDTVREELRAFQGLMKLVVAEWDRGWLPLVLASDVSERWYGITSMSTKSSEAAKVGRVAERSRFRHNGNLGVRASAFQEAGYWERWANAVGVDQQSLQDALPQGNEMWELNDRFPEVHGEWRAKSLWTVER